VRDWYAGETNLPLFSGLDRVNIMGLWLSRLVPAIKMASSSMTGTSASEEDNSARIQGRSGWEGSEVTPADISWVTSTRRVPEGVACRLPVGEATPAPEPDERVVFITHFERGFGLPASDFFRDFLDVYGL
jgi:hypothetical protein